jgi:hypothetical protein
MSDEFKMVDGSRPLIPEGPYSVQYLKHEKRIFFGTLKMYVHFEMVEQGQFFGTRLFKTYNFSSPLSPGSDLYRDLLFLFGQRVPKNARLSMDLFKNVILRVRVRTVKRDRKQNPLPDYMQYSVIDSLLGKETGLVTGGVL